mgnify:FL=1
MVKTFEKVICNSNIINQINAGIRYYKTPQIFRLWFYKTKNDVSISLFYRLNFKEDNNIRQIVELSEVYEKSPKYKKDLNQKKKNVGILKIREYDK